MKRRENDPRNVTVEGGKGGWRNLFHKLECSTYLLHCTPYFIVVSFYC
jgi:hypothetical protein